MAKQEGEKQIELVCHGPGAIVDGRHRKIPDDLPPLLERLNNALRHHVTPAGRGKRKLIEVKTPAQRRNAMTCAQRLKRVFKIDIETGDQCGGTVKVIACSDDPAIVKRIEGLPRATDRSRHNTHAPRLSAAAGGSAGRILISSSQERNARTAR